MSTTEKAINIKPETREMADKIAATFKIDSKGVPTVEPGSYIALIQQHVPLLPEGKAEETLTQIQDFNTLFLTAGNLAFGEKAIPVFKKNKELEKIQMDYPTTGKDDFSFGITKKQEFKVGDNPPTTKFCSTSVAINLHAGKTRGQMNHVKNHLAALGLKAFGDN